MVVNIIPFAQPYHGVDPTIATANGEPLAWPSAPSQSVPAPDLLKQLQDLLTMAQKTLPKVAAPLRYILWALLVLIVVKIFR